MKRTVDYGYRSLFGGLLLYAPFAAVTSSRSQASIFLMLEGISGVLLLVTLALLGGLIWIDVGLNGWKHKIRWRWLTKHREYLYILGSAAAICVPFSLSRHELIETSAIWWYGCVFMSGSHLALLDINAKLGNYMSRTSRTLAMWAALAWPVLALAESTFEESLTLYGWKTWVIICGWCAAGTALRWAYDHGKFRDEAKKAIAADLKPPLPPSFSDFFAMSVVAFFSGIATFAVIEAVCQYYKYTPPSGIVGAAIAISAFNNKRTIAALSTALFDVLDKFRPKAGSNETK